MMRMVTVVAALATLAVSANAETIKLSCSGTESLEGARSEVDEQSVVIDLDKQIITGFFFPTFVPIVDINDSMITGYRKLESGKYDTFVTATVLINRMSGKTGVMITYIADGGFGKLDQWDLRCRVGAQKLF